MTQGDIYRSIKAVSNSLMGTFEDKYGEFIAYWVFNRPLSNKSTGSLTFGSIVDILLTQPEQFDKTFIVYSKKPPRKQIMEFCQFMANGMTNTQAYDAVGFKRDKFDAVLLEFHIAQDYYTFIQNRNGRNVITKDDYDKARKIVDELKTGEYTKDIVTVEEDIIGGIDVYNQLELTDRLLLDDHAVNVKGALDRVIVDHNKKRIKPYDFKTSFSVDEFEHSYIQWRYYRQASFYSYLLRRWANNKEYTNYVLEPFRFIVCSTSGERHYLYEQSTHDMECARWGGELLDGTQIRGWDSILKEIAYMTELGDWSYNYKARVNNGIVPLKQFK